MNEYSCVVRWRTIEYYVARVRGNMQMINQLDLVGRTSELARLFGIEFYSVLSRGTQVSSRWKCLHEMIVVSLSE